MIKKLPLSSNLMSAKERPEIWWLKFCQRKPEAPHCRHAISSNLGRPGIKILWYLFRTGILNRSSAAHN